MRERPSYEGASGRRHGSVPGKGSDTSSNLLSGMTTIGVLESIGSVRSPTETVR